MLIFSTWSEIISMADKSALPKGVLGKGPSYYVYVYVVTFP